jgi:hypothetical protein
MWHRRLAESVARSAENRFEATQDWLAHIFAEAAARAPCPNRFDVAVRFELALQAELRTARSTAVCCGSRWCRRWRPILVSMVRSAPIDLVSSSISVDSRQATHRLGHGLGSRHPVSPHSLSIRAAVESTMRAALAGPNLRANRGDHSCEIPQMRVCPGPRSGTITRWLVPVSGEREQPTVGPSVPFRYQGGTPSC